MGKITRKGRDRTPFAAPSTSRSKNPPFYKAGQPEPEEEEVTTTKRPRVEIPKGKTDFKAKVSLFDLVMATRRYDAKRVERTPYIDIEISNVIPYFGTKSLLFTARSLSGTSAKIKYPTVIAFYNIEFIDGEENWKRGMLKFENPDTGAVVVCNKPDYRRTPVRVYCACPDFYFTFAYPDYNKQCYYGKKPKPYKHVMPPSGYPPKNPNNIPGLCKHILNMVNLLIKQDYIK